jgi:hypothetical protein
VRKILVSVGCSVALSACSTGSVPPLSAQSATNLLVSSAGVYSGTSSTNVPITLLSLYNGAAYLFYQKPVAGVIVVSNGQQTGNGHFTGTAATQYTLAPNAAASPVQVQIDFSRAPNVSGTVAGADNGTGPMTFSATPKPTLGQGPGLGAVAGEYNGQMGSMQRTGSAQMLIAGDGLLAGTMGSGCEFRGKVAPDSGVNAYSASVTFSGTACAAPNATVTGSALLDEGRLLIALPKQDRSDVIVFDGTK